MSRRDRLAGRLRELEALRRAADARLAQAKLAEALADSSNQIVATAARAAGDLQIEELEPDLAQAFAFFMIKPAKRDPGCAAKTAVVETLVSWRAAQHDLYLEGIRHVQLEPVYGGREDTAGALRAHCALGLARSHARDVLVPLADLLADPNLDARLGAVRAIAEAGVPGAIALLRYKARRAEDDARVQLACFESLLALAPRESVPLVAGFLSDDEPAVAEAAALALGESRLAAALAPLMAAWEAATEPPLRRTILTSVALLRSEKALDILLGLLTEGDRWQAREALEALALFRHDESVWSRVQDLAVGRDDLS